MKIATLSLLLLTIFAGSVEAGSGGSRPKSGDKKEAETNPVDDGTTIEEEKLVKVTSPVFEVPGTQEELATKGKACIAQIVKNDAIQIRDNSDGNLFGGPGAGNTNSISGGELLVSEDLPAGLVVANNRVGYSSAMIRYNVKSTLAFQAKENRFRIVHTNIQRVMLSTGYARNDGYNDICTNWGCGYADAAGELQALSAKIAKCVEAPAASEDW